MGCCDKSMNNKISRRVPLLEMTDIAHAHLMTDIAHAH